MSARLIRVAAQTPVEIFAPLAIREEDPLNLPVVIETTDDLSSPHQPDEEASLIVAQAKASAAQIEQQAYDAGHARIQDEIEAAVSRLVNPWQEQLTHSLDHMATVHASVIGHAERDLIRLALEIAARVIRREVQTDREIVLNLARAGLSYLQHRTAAQIHLHPDDLAYVRERSQSLKANHSIELIEDHAIERGGCLIQSEMGDVDARLEAQLEEIETVLLEV